MKKRFAASVQKEEVVEFLNHSSPNALLPGVRVNSGPREERGVRTLLDTQVGRAGWLHRPQTPPRAWCGQVAGRPRNPTHLQELHPQAGGMNFQPKTPRVAYLLAHRTVSPSSFLKPKCLRNSVLLGLRLAFLKPPRLGESLTCFSSLNS